MDSSTLDRIKHSMDAMLSRSTTATLPGGIEVMVRPMPFVTMTYLIMEAFTALKGDREEIRNVIGKALESISKDRETVTLAEMLVVIDVVTPLLRRLVTMSPQAMRRVLKDAVVGVTDQVVEVFPADAAMVVLSATLDGLDKTVLVDHVQRVFSHAVSTGRMLAERTKATAPATTTS